MSTNPEARGAQVSRDQRTRLESGDGESQKRQNRMGSGSETEKNAISCVSCRQRKLRCDRIKPKCGACIKARRVCEYPQRQSKLSLKQQRIIELEDRVDQLETMLAATSKTELEQGFSTQIIETDRNTRGTSILGSDFLDSNFSMPPVEMGFETSPMLRGFIPQELLPLGMQEPLPDKAMRDELYELYFEKVYPMMPMIHKLRYYASLDLPPHMRPPPSLQYAIWANAASVSDKYLYYQDVLYERARKYSREAEMKDYGEGVVSIYHAQTWGLLATYEAKKMFVARAWTSTGRMARLVHMLRLHKLDVDSSGNINQMSPQDWIQLEERRRTFWAAFYGDRLSSFSSGLPMIFQEDEIMTNLPASAESFEYGIAETSVSLKQAITPEGAAKVSSFGGVILSVAVFSHNFQHLNQNGPNERPDDLDGEFWKRHRNINNMISKTFMFLPDHLKLPTASRDMNVIILHLNIHASYICLHEAAIATASQHQLGSEIIRQSRAQRLTAAEQIANVMRLVSHVDASNMSPCIGSPLYIAARVFVQQARLGENRLQCISNLEFLVAAMYTIGRRHPITNHFTAQLELDIETAGIDKPSGFPPKNEIVTTRTMVDGLLVGLRI